MSKQLSKKALAFKALVEFSDSIPAENAGGASALLSKALNPQPEPPKVNSGQFSRGSAQEFIFDTKS